MSALSMRSLRFSVLTYLLSCPAFPRHGFALRASHGYGRFGTMRALTPGLLRLAGQVSSFISQTRPGIPPPTTWPARTSFPIANPNVSGVFQASPSPSRLAAVSPPNRVRHPADCQFASSCSPPRLAATQLPSATGSWLAPTRTFTVLCVRLHERTRSGLQAATTRAPPSTRRGLKPAPTAAAMA